MYMIWLQFSVDKVFSVLLGKGIDSQLHFRLISPLPNRQNNHTLALRLENRVPQQARLLIDKKLLINPKTPSTDPKERP